MNGILYHTYSLTPATKFIFSIVIVSHKNSELQYILFYRFSDKNISSALFDVKKVRDKSTLNKQGIVKN